MKIYTKTGDLGDTSLFNGKRVRKNNIRIDSYGTIDELNSYIGMILDQIHNQVKAGDEVKRETQAENEDKDRGQIRNQVKSGDAQNKDQNTFNELSNTLLTIQSKLFTLGAMLATPAETGKRKEKKSRLQIDLIGSDDIMLLENEMDKMNEELPEMTHFILPGGHPAVSFCHIARCVCRRAERKTVELHDLEGVDKQILTYLNRLSDYLFVLARKLSKDLGVDEIPWRG
jgi:cob(I)alamin adenosyltransferase